MPVKQAVQSQSRPPASLPLHNYISGQVCVRLVHHSAAGGKNQAERCSAVKLSSSATSSSSLFNQLTPSLPGKRVCTRSNGPIKCLDYSMCRYLSGVLVAARR